MGLGGSGIDTTRVFSYAEYDVQRLQPGKTEAPLDGYLFRECGYRGSTAAGRAGNCFSLDY